MMLILDYHGTNEEYGNAKARITANQTNADYLIYNAGPRRKRQMAALHRRT